MPEDISSFNEITSGLFYNKKEYLLDNRVQIVHVIKYTQNKNKNLDLLISKSSEAINPNGDLNHIGEGSNIDTLLVNQVGIRFIINAGFNHYMKDFYEWKNKDFNIGDPVGIVKIREHKFEDYLTTDNYGFLLQKDRKSDWVISEHLIDTDYKYILGCTPILIFNNVPKELPEMNPVPLGVINPPSYLGHGNQIHPRTAVGMIDNDIYFIVVENNINGNGGCTLKELQSIGISLNLESMLNLDGGGSSQFKIIEDSSHSISNFISEEDNKRILGHTFMIFDENLK